MRMSVPHRPARAPTMTRLARGSYTNLVVRLGTLNTNNWASLLRFRQQFREADLDVTTNSEGTSTASSGESTNGTGSDTVTDGSEPATGNPGAAHEISSRTVAHQIIHVKNRPLPPETRAAIRQQANSGLGARKVAHRYGVHENTVRAIWREHTLVPSSEDLTASLRRIANVPKHCLPRGEPSSRSGWN